MPCSGHAELSRGVVFCHPKSIRPALADDASNRLRNHGVLCTTVSAGQVRQLADATES